MRKQREKKSSGCKTDRGSCPTALKQKHPALRQRQRFTELTRELALRGRNSPLQSGHLGSFHSYLFPLSSQPSHHRSVMRQPISWTPRAQWPPRHLKLVTVYMLVLLVSLSFASGQSRRFKHQIDNRSKYEAP